MGAVNELLLTTLDGLETLGREHQAARTPDPGDAGLWQAAQAIAPDLFPGSLPERPADWAGFDQVIDAYRRGRSTPASSEGLTAYVVMWDRGTEADPVVWVRATAVGANRLRYSVMQEHWDEVAAYDGYPEEIPDDHDAALKIWDDAREQNADPKIGIFSVDKVTIGS